MRFLVLHGHFCNDGFEFDFQAADTTAVGEAPRCQACGRFCGMMPFKPPIKGTLVAEGSIFDLSANAQDVLVTKKCFQALEENGIRGLVEPQPIEILAVEGPFELAQVGPYLWAHTRCGAEIDRVKSNLRTTALEPCPKCGFAGLIEGYDRVEIIESSWTGNDFFSVKGLPGVILATERVKELCETMEFNVCGLTPAEAYCQNWTQFRAQEP